jgi:2-(acetamidomethylene)succinate hydrolase
MSEITEPSPAPPTPIAFEDGFVDLDGHRIAVRTWAGNGPPLLLIHGISSAGSVWNPIIPRLAREFTPVAIDQRGHGASDKPETGYLYDDYVGDLAGVLDALGLDRPLIVGHSLGGIVTLWWAARYPDRAAGLVIEDSPLHSGEDYMPAFDEWLMLNAMPEEDLRAHYAEAYPEWPPELVLERARLMAGTARGVFAELRADSLAHHGVDRIAEISGISSPVLLIHGDLEAGGMVTPEDAAAFEDRLANAASVRIPGAGHTLHRERPDDFLGVALPFLRQHAPQV